MEVVLRFFGRFLVAQPQSGGEINLLALGMGKESAHRYLMTMKSVKLKPDTSGKETRANGDFRVISSAQPENSSHLAWDLTNCDFNIRSNGSEGLPPFRWSEGVVPEKLSKLLELASTPSQPSPEFDESHVHGNTGAIISTIHLTSGIGTADSLSQDYYRWVSVEGGEETGAETKLAEMVQIQFTNLQSPTLELTDRESGQKICEVGLAPLETKVVINFSNLCTAVPLPGSPDKEFALFYELLKSTSRQACVVPVGLPHVGRSFPCFAMAYVTYSDPVSGSS